MRSKPASGMNTSPRTSSSAGAPAAQALAARARMVRRLAVMSSPVSPSPRVAPCDEEPVAVGALTASPSSLGSAE